MKCHCAQVSSAHVTNEANVHSTLGDNVSVWYNRYVFVEEEKKQKNWFQNFNKINLVDSHSSTIFSRKNEFLVRKQQQKNNFI